MEIVERKIDKLGRICIPKEMRKLFNLEREVELWVTSEGILLKNPEYMANTLRPANRATILRLPEKDKIHIT